MSIFLYAQEKGPKRTAPFGTCLRADTHRQAGPVGKRASTRQAPLSGPLTIYRFHLITYSHGSTTLAGSAFRADTDISSLFSFCFFFVLFLVRPRKRTKKNGAVRHGAGFSTKRLRGADQLQCPTNPCGIPRRWCWTDQRGKTPHATTGRTRAARMIRRDLPPIPLPEGRRNGDGSMYWPSESAEIAFSYQSERT